MGVEALVGEDSFWRKRPVAPRTSPGPRSSSQTNRARVSGRARLVAHILPVVLPHVRGRTSGGVGGTPTPPEFLYVSIAGVYSPADMPNVQATPSRAVCVRGGTRRKYVFREPSGSGVEFRTSTMTIGSSCRHVSVGPRGRSQRRPVSSSMPERAVSFADEPLESEPLDEHATPLGVLLSVDGLDGDALRGLDHPAVDRHAMPCMDREPIAEREGRAVFGVQTALVRRGRPAAAAR